MSRARPVLLDAIDGGFHRASWHGPNLRSALRGIAPELALWRPAPSRHNVAEQALHAAYWKYVVRRRLTGAKRGSFPLPGSNWFPVESLTRVTWRAHLLLLEDQHAALYDAVKRICGAREQPSPLQVRLILGAAAHDVYHAGQIRLLRALWLAEH